MIILEEDLDVSKDLMDYFSQLLPVYGSDQSVYCISAWNDQVGFNGIIFSENWLNETKKSWFLAM